MKRFLTSLLHKKIWRKKRFWAWLVLGLVAAFLLFLQLFPIGIRWNIQRFLRKMNAPNLVIRGVEFNPFDGRIAIHNFFNERVATGDGGEVGYTGLQVKWMALRKRQVSLEGFTLSNVTLDVIREANGVIHIGGLTILPSSNTQTTVSPEKKSAPWGMGVDSIFLDNVRVHYKDPKLALDVLLDELYVAPFATWRADAPTTFSLRMQVNGGSIRLKGEATPFSQNPATSITIQVLNIPLDFLNDSLADSGVRNLAGEFGMKAGVHADYGTTTTAMNLFCDGSLSLKGLHADTPAARLVQGGVVWNGTLQTSGTLTSPTLSVNGALDLLPLLVELTQPSLRVAHDGLRWQGKINATPGKEGSVQTSSTLTLKDLALRMPSAEDGSSSKSLSFTQSGLEWRGNIDYLNATSGSLVLDGALALTSLTLADPKNGFALERLDSLHLNPIRVKTGAAALPQALAINGALQLGNLRALVGSAGLRVEQKGLDWKGAIDLGPGNTPLHVSSDLALRGLQATDVKTSVSLASLGEFKLQNSVITKTSQTLSTSCNLLASDMRARLEAQKLSVSESAFSWRGECTLPTNNPSALHARGDLAGKGISVQDLKRGLELAGLDGFDIRSVQLDGVAKTTVRTIALRGLRAFQKTAARSAPSAESHLFSLKELGIDSVSYQPAGLQTRSVRFAGLNALLALNKQGELDMLSRLPGVATPAPEQKQAPAKKVVQQAPKSVAQQNAKTTQSFAVQLDKLELAGENKVVFDDASVRPPVHMTLQPFTFTVSQIDTAKPSQPIPLTLRANLDTYGSIAFDGSLKPLDSTPGADITAVLKQVNLSPLSSYAERAVGYRLKRGVLSTDLTVRLNQGNLDVLCKLLLGKLELERLKAEEMDEMGKQLGLPINTALALLRDGEDNITLKIPIQGNLNDPKVRIGSIVFTALKNALTGTLTSVLSPLGMPLEAGKWLTGGKNIGLKSAEFLPGTADFASGAPAHLETLAKTLKDRPGLQITLSGISAKAADVRAIANAQQEEVRKKALIPLLHARKQAPEESAPPVQNEQLLQLAEQRAKAVKDFLTERGVAPQRLMLTTPAIDEKPDAQARVDLTL